LFIAHGADLKGRAGVVKIDASTGQASLIPPDRCAGRPYWAASGTSFFCQDLRAQSIVEVDVESGEVKRSFPGKPQGFAASPDGRLIVHPSRSLPGEPAGLMILTLATGESREIVTFPPPNPLLNSVHAVSFTADSRSIVFKARIAGEYGVWIASITGGQPRKIELDADVGRISVWRVNARTGQVLYALETWPAVDIWKMENFLPVLAKPF
jgi:hypothetical protein